MTDLARALAGDPVEVAPLLLGALLRHRDVAVRITEVEAYAGADDPGSHAFRGRTPRTSAMFGPAAHLYVYLSYGVHVCANVVVGPPGLAGAVLLRAGEVVEGHETARARRGGASSRDLARGPGRLGQAVGLQLVHDGADLEGDEVRLELGAPPPRTRVRTGPRVGLSRAADREWRFWLDGESTVSTYRRSPRAPLTHPDLHPRGGTL